MMKVLIRDEDLDDGFVEVMDECPDALRSKLLDLPIVQLWLDNRDDTELEDFVRHDTEVVVDKDDLMGVIPKEDSCSLPYLIWLIEKFACSDATIYTKGIITMSQTEQLFFASKTAEWGGYCLQDKVDGMLTEFPKEMKVTKEEVIAYLYEHDDYPSDAVELLVDAIANGEYD